jgi:hypothetical protein
MQVASRPRLNAGIALVGASVIAVSPLAPPMPDIHLPNPAHVVASVELAAAALATAPPSYAQVIQEAVANAQALLTTFEANPTPILSQVAHNQAITIQNLIAALQTTGGAIGTALTTTVPPLLQAAFNDLASGNVEGATNNVLSAILAPVFPITGFIPALSAAFTQPLTNLVAAINAVQAGGVLSPLSFAVTGLLGPVLSGAGAFGVAVDNVGSAIGAGDPQAVLNAVVNGPATILDGVLNGGFGPDLSSLAGLAGIKVVAGGLLSGGLAITTPNGVVTIQLPGTINSLEALATAFANALTPPKVTATATTTADVKSLSTSPAALPAAGATTLALTTAPATKAIEAAAPKDATDTSAAAKDSSATGTSATDATTKSSTSSTDATDSSTSSAAASTGDTTTKGDPADSTAASGSSSTGDTSTKGATGTKSGGDTKGGSNAKGDGGAKKSGDTGSKSGSNSKGSGGGGGRHRK